MSKNRKASNTQSTIYWNNWIKNKNKLHLRQPKYLTLTNNKKEFQNY